MPCPFSGDLAVEVVSKSNTKPEIARKLQEYFAAGSRLAWIVDPKPQTVRVHTAPGEHVVLGIDDWLDGGKVLPGFRVPVRDLFQPEWMTPPRILRLSLPLEFENS